VGRIVQAACAALLILLVLTGTGLAAEVSERIPEVSDLTRDPTAVAGVPWWTGVISRLTNLCWAVAAAVNAMAARVAAGRQRRALLLLAGLCAVLALDDTMLVHDSIMPGHGVPEDLLLLVYAVAGLALAVLWVRTSWRREVVGAFFAGAAALGLSVAADVVHSLPFLVEDGAKLTGIVAWCLCGVWAHSDMLRVVQPEASRAADRLVAR
jgi:cytochrome bd-type quinol oxidase subunit 2